MDAESPTDAELADAIADATRRGVKLLLHEHPDDTFYYFSLITTGEAHAPQLTAWSVEALGSVAAQEEDPAAAREMLKWSYADSPFLYETEQCFEQVRTLFDARPQWTDGLTDEEWHAEYELRLRAMERAIALLDREGLFGTGTSRLQVVVNAEVMPPDHANTERARRLNPPQALDAWLEEAAE